MNFFNSVFSGRTDERTKGGAARLFKLKIQSSGAVGVDGPTWLNDGMPVVEVEVVMIGGGGNVADRTLNVLALVGAGVLEVRTVNAVVDGMNDVLLVGAYWVETGLDISGGFGGVVLVAVPISSS